MRDRPYRILQLKDEAEWLEERHKRITGSAVSVLFGQNPWTTRDELLDQKSQPEPFTLQDKATMAWGRAMEVPNMRVFGKAAGARVRPSNLMLESSVDPRVSVTIDGLLVPSSAEPETIYWGNQSQAWEFITQMRNAKGIGLVEMKQTSAWSGKHWRTSAPDHYVTQLLLQLAVTGLEWGALVARVGASDLRAYYIERDLFWEEEMFRLVDEFFEDLNDDTF